MPSTFFDFLASAIFILVIILVGWIGYSTYIDQKNWEDFKVNSDCAIISKEFTNSVQNYIQANGQVGVLVVPKERVGWICNDGIIYYR